MRAQEEVKNGRLWAELGGYCGVCGRYVELDPDVTGDTLTQFVEQIRSAVQFGDLYLVGGPIRSGKAHFICADCINGTTEGAGK